MTIVDQEVPTNDNDRITQLEKQNAALMGRLDSLITKLAESPVATTVNAPDRKAKDGHKLVKVRILADDGDLEMGIIEVPKSDKRKAFDPATDTVNNGVVAQRGNPMANSKLGDNDVSVTGI